MTCATHSAHRTHIHCMLVCVVFTGLGMTRVTKKCSNLSSHLRVKMAGDIGYRAKELALASDGTLEHENTGPYIGCSPLFSSPAMMDVLWDPALWRLVSSQRGK